MEERHAPVWFLLWRRQERSRTIVSIFGYRDELGADVATLTSYFGDCSSGRTSYPLSVVEKITDARNSSVSIPRYELRCGPLLIIAANRHHKLFVANLTPPMVGIANFTNLQLQFVETTWLARASVAFYEERATIH